MKYWMLAVFTLFVDGAAAQQNAVLHFSCEGSLHIYMNEPPYKSAWEIKVDLNKRLMHVSSLYGGDSINGLTYTPAAYIGTTTILDRKGAQLGEKIYSVSRQDGSFSYIWKRLPGSFSEEGQGTCEKKANLDKAKGVRLK